MNKIEPKNNLGLKRIQSSGILGPIDSKPERKVLVLYIGGTIGMVKNENGALVPKANILKKKIETYPLLHDAEYAYKKFGTNDSCYLVLPETEEPYRVLYTIQEYSPLLDSSNMSMNEWIQIATDIKRAYQIYDGFVILHGTDTLTYTASALSFMFENLGKTVVITGSQIPIFQPRSDGKENFFSAVLFAGCYNIPEVTIYFKNKLFRGNRTIKVSSISFDAFDSPNIQPLATVGIKIEVNYKNIFRTINLDKFFVHTKLNPNVGLLRIFPYITTETVKLFLQPPIQGVVLQSYGSGNISTNRKDLLEVLEEATSKGIIIVNCTQCAEGCVQDIYETGQILKKVGVIFGADMTPEAALSKLSYVLSKDEWDLPKKQEVNINMNYFIDLKAYLGQMLDLLFMMGKNLRGELTTVSFEELNEFDLVEAVATTLNLTSAENIYHLRNVLCPAMLLSAVSERNLTKIKTLKSLGMDLFLQDHDKRTALHVACANGDIEIVDYLLQNGCNVHVRDRLDRTPLQDAIENNHHQIIELLVKCGAHITGSGRYLGEQLCLAAARGSVIRLQSYQLAGAKLNQVDSCGRTALHVAVLHGHEEVVKYLLSQDCDPFVFDMTGMSPLTLADFRQHESIASLLKNLKL